ncbi:MAG TPA: hypothetical protein VF376_12400 [Thermoanaerobaculia bacterium]
MSRIEPVAALLLVGLALPLYAQSTDSASAPLRGVRGEPTARAVVRWSDMERAAIGKIHVSRKEDSDGPGRIQKSLPVPKDAVVRVESWSEAVPQMSFGLPSPQVAASFEALPNSPDQEPPDTHGAVGLQHLMVTLNSDVRIQDRSGNPISTVPLWAFWQSLSAGGEYDVFDPRVLYDPFADRWITTAAERPASNLLVGVSQSGDPTGSWNLYKLPTTSFVDAPKVGFNRDWIVVMTNTGTSTIIWVFGKAGLYAGGSGSFRSFGAGNQIIAPVPAVTLDADVSTLYLVSDWSGNTDGKGVLRLYEITGPVGSESMTSVAFEDTPQPWADFGPDCPQKGDPRGISCFGFPEVVFRNGTIWMTHAIGLPADHPTHAAIQWWQLTPNGDVVQRGRLEDVSGAASYAFPSIAVNRRGDMMLGFASFSELEFASAGYAYHAASDPPGTLRSPSVLKSGEDSYFRDQGGFGTNRWGDYSATTVDPVNDTDFWTIQEYAAARDKVSGHYMWGTWWGHISPDSADRIPPRPPAPRGEPHTVPPRGGREGPPP